VSEGHQNCPSRNPEIPWHSSLHSTYHSHRAVIKPSSFKSLLPSLCPLLLFTRTTDLAQVFFILRKIIAVVSCCDRYKNENTHPLHHLSLSVSFHLFVAPVVSWDLVELWERGLEETLSLTCSLSSLLFFLASAI
jgi:hypothetical protein